MTKNSNRKGLALGAIFALVSSLFVSAPAAQANEAGLIVEPIAGTSYTMVNTEDFILTTRLGSQIQSDRASALKYIIAKSGTAGYGLSVSHTVSPTALDGAFPEDIAANAASISSITTASTQSVVATPLASAAFNTKNQLKIQPWSTSGLTTLSPALSVTVTAFLDLNNDGLVTGTEPNTVVTINFVSLSSMGASVTLTQPIQGDVRATASATLATVNHQQLNGAFKLGFVSSQQGMTNPANASSSATISPAALAAGTSFSANIAAATVSATSVPSLSAVIFYSSTLTSNDFTVANTNRVATQTLGVSKAQATALTLATVVSDHALANGTVRPNQTYTVRVGATNAGVSASAAAVTVTFAGSTGLVTGSKTVSINGGAELTSYPTSLTLTTGTDGFASFTLKTTGFEVNNKVSVLAVAGNARATLDVTATAPVFSIVNDFADYLTAPGTAVNIGYTVEDQWEVLSTRTDLRIMVTRGSATGSKFNYSETVSYVAVVGGKASFAFTPAPATTTGSATVTSALQRLNSDSNVWLAEANTVAADPVAVNVSSVASGFSVSPAVSLSASVSYFPSTVSYKAFTTTLTNAGASVEISGPAALIFREQGKTVTSSGAITLRASSTGVVNFEVASLLEGTHTITYKVGSATTTSQLVVDPVKGSAGVKIAFDKSSIVAGETAVITGKVTDVNGNPVNTTNTDGGSALLVVSYTGKGLPFNTGSSIETDEKGEFKVNVLALAGDAGTGTLTATYRPAGAAVDVNNVTATQTITIVAPAAPAAPEVNAVIGSFNGRWAVRVENAKGATVAVKVGGRWVKYTSLNDNYLFSRKSVKGRSVAVAVYVNGTLENVATITIK